MRPSRCGCVGPLLEGESPRSVVAFLPMVRDLSLVFLDMAGVDAFGVRHDAMRSGEVTGRIRGVPSAGGSVASFWLRDWTELVVESAGFGLTF
jgi:hypothetical protein